MTRVNIQSDARSEEDKLLLPLIPLVAEHPFPFLPSLLSHNLLAHLIWVTWSVNEREERQSDVGWGGVGGGEGFSGKETDTER